MSWLLSVSHMKRTCQLPFRPKWLLFWENSKILTDRKYYRFPQLELDMLLPFHFVHMRWFELNSLSKEVQVTQHPTIIIVSVIYALESLEHVLEKSSIRKMCTGHQTETVTVADRALHRSYTTALFPRCLWPYVCLWHGRQTISGAGTSPES